MTAEAPRLRLARTRRSHERPVKLRLPFRFGVITLTEAPQAFVRARVRLADGPEGDGIAAELLVPKWFDKAPELSNEDNFNQLRRSLALARSHIADAGTGTVFGLTAAVEQAHHAACAAENLNGLVASFGLALMERAIIDALGRLTGGSVFALVRENRIGLSAATAPDLAGFDIGKFLSGLQPAPSIHVRHTVGLVDALTRAETSGKRLDDGLPESLEEVIATYRHRYFKLKVAGNLDADIDRLSRIAAVLDQSAAPYWSTLDGNEQFAEIGAVAALWRRMAKEPRLQRLKSSILFIEQPIARAKALAEPVHALGRDVPIEIDELDADVGVFPRGRALGYRGISAKSCKGIVARAHQPCPRRAVERGRRRRALLHVGRRPHHTGGRRGPAGPCAGDPHRRHACRAQRPSLCGRDGGCATRPSRTPSFRRIPTSITAARTGGRGSRSARAPWRSARSPRRRALRSA